MHFFIFHATLLYCIMLGEAEWGPGEEQPHKE